MELSIGFINDAHGYLEPHPELFYNKDGEYIKTAGGYAKIATIFEKIKRESEHTLFFDGGDTFHGTLPAVSSKGEALIPPLFGVFVLVSPRTQSRVGRRLQRPSVCSLSIQLCPCCR